MNNIRNSIQAALDLMGEAKFVKAAEILFSVLAQPITENTDALIIQYHEETIKRQLKEIDALKAVLKQALEECVWPSMRVSDVYTKATAAIKEGKT